MRKLLVVFPLLLVLVGGCDSTRRDFGVCDTTYSSCLKGFTCDFNRGLCVPDVDGGALDTQGVETSPPIDTQPIDVSLADTKDAPITIDGTSIDSSVVDTTIVDAPIVDVAIPDTRIPDAAGTCSVDNDCFGIAAGAYCVNTKCVACKISSQCNNDAGVPFCSAQNTCVSCAKGSSADGGSSCPASSPVCAASGSCVQCVHNSDCPNPNAAFCVQNQCVGCNVPGATASAPVSGGSDGGAADGGTVPDGGGGTTGPCTGAKPVCATTGTIAGECVQCVTSTDCSGTTPICNLTATSTIPANTCTACTSDTQCSDKGVGPGVCMFHQDGRCASYAETIYVKNTSTCVGGSGTASSPYCDSQAAINAVTSGARLIVMEGPSTDGLSSISSTPAGKQVTIVGQNGATTAAGASIGVHVTAGDVYIRGLAVANGSKAGLVVESGATIRMDRCVVTGNSGGGLVVMSGASFDVANSVFAANQGGVVGVAQFAAVYLGGSAPSTGPSKFWYNTVVNNLGATAVVCFDSQPLIAMLMHGNQGDFLNCVLDGTSAWESGNPIPNGATSFTLDPALNATYHLTSSSPKYPQPCRDFIAATVAHPFDDMDGELRPKNTRLDCGADEY